MIPIIVIVASGIPAGTEAKEKTKKAYLRISTKERAKDLYQRVSAVDIMPLCLSGTTSANACYQREQKRLMERFDQIQRNGADSLTLSSATLWPPLWTLRLRLLQSPLTLLTSS
ncbi:hypothetical protein P153DRAFT_391208 [Dothidotthia symphoricarpi CBS 119687]|uniref:Uncharacterized protein n=1 Tax=Dothidotthia symphoricarpi CBS 119687 TaxID=1392245 RepID=A0A6A5ZWW2_9PLEO|nr:uncharacterized protein P153DRAFT_391208 [Dothidotthia symphoricarpi CBS 119687]KAF2123786.1 hypothetical protein P153DRAFT_391208 [Dothidotthia symphoricarpi CBS 119687]